MTGVLRMTAWRVFAAHTREPTLPDMAEDRVPHNRNNRNRTRYFKWRDRIKAWQKDFAALATTNKRFRAAMLPLFANNITVACGAFIPGQSRCDTEELVRRKCQLYYFPSLTVCLRSDNIGNVLAGLTDKRCEQLRRLQIRGGFFIDPSGSWSQYFDDIVGRLVSRCTGLLHLDIFHSPNVDDVTISMLAAKCPGLVSISLIETGVTDLGLSALAQKCCRLKDVDLLQSRHMKDAGIKSLFQNCRSLTKLDLTGCQHVTGSGFSSLNCPALVRISLHDCNISDEAMTDLAAGCRSLACINISASTVDSWVTDNTLCSLGQHCSNLVEIYLNGCDQITNEGLAALAKGCGKITCIDLNGCVNITDVGVAQLADNCRDLADIYLTDCPKITDVAMKALAACVHLAYVDVAYCGDIGDAGIIPLTGSCPGLVEIDLENCRALTDASILELASWCRGLTTVNLTNCIHITDEGVAALTEGCRGIADIRLKNCAHVTDASLFALATKCARIEILDIGGCCKVTDAGMTALSASCCNLESVNLSRCNLITDITIGALAERCPKLSFIATNGCSSLTGDIHDTRTKVKTKNPTIMISNMSHLPTRQCFESTKSDY